MRRATFAIGSTGTVEVLQPTRVLEHANRVYARGHYPLTAEERMIIRVMREIHASPWIVGLDTQGIANRERAL